MEKCTGIEMVFSMKSKEEQSVTFNFASSREKFS